MREKYIEKKLKDEVEKRGGVCWKFTSSTDGVPDRIILLKKGKVIFVETKAPGEKPRPLQMARINKIRELGSRAEVIDGVEGLKRFLEKIDEEDNR